YKIDPAAQAMIADPLLAQENDGVFAIQLVMDPPQNAETMTVIDAVRTAPVRQSYSILNYQNIIVQIPPRSLPQVAAQPDVVSIQPYFSPRHCDERQDQIVAGNLSGNNPSGPGYLAWLGTHGFTQAQFTTSGFAVDVSDSGLDNGTTSPNHFGL